MSTNLQEHLRLDRLKMTYGEITAVDDISLSVPEGEFVALLGPSGCGKTTTLRLVAGFIHPTAGQILVGGKAISHLPPYKRGMGMVFQSYALFPHMDVFGNVVFGLQMSRVPKRQARDRVLAALRRVRLEGYEKRRISELSGGQQQRVALARAMVIEPNVLLLDEPLSNLDAKLRDEMREEIRSIQRDVGITTLFVTHDQVEALTMADRVVVMNEGKVEQVDVPENIYERPASRFVANFIGRANFIPAEVESSGSQSSKLAFAGGSIAAPAALAVGAKASIMVRPHRIEIGRSESGYPGRVGSVAYLGDIIQYGIFVGEAHINVEQSSNRMDAKRFSEGDEVVVSWQPEDSLVFDQDGALARPN